MKKTLCILSLGLMSLLVGCSDLTPVTLNAKASDPQGLVSGLPAAGENICLQSAGMSDAYLDLVTRTALDDHGFNVIWLNHDMDPTVTCRFVVTLTTQMSVTHLNTPNLIVLDYQDRFTGETQRAMWRRPGTQTPVSGDMQHVSNLLLPRNYFEPERVIRNLVDQLFPMPN